MRSSSSRALRSASSKLIEPPFLTPNLPAPSFPRAEEAPTVADEEERVEVEAEDEVVRVAPSVLGRLSEADEVVRRDEDVTVRGAEVAGGVERRVPPGVEGREPPRPTRGGVIAGAGERGFFAAEGGASHVSKKSPSPAAFAAGAAAVSAAPSTTTRSLPYIRSSSAIFFASSSLYSCAPRDRYFSFVSIELGLYEPGCRERKSRKAAFPPHFMARS